MSPELTFEVKKYAMRQSKDGVILSVVVHPSDASTELLSAPIGQQWIMALAPYVESRSASGEQEGDREGSPKAGRGLSRAERAIKFAHIYDSNDAGVLDLIHSFCGVQSCTEFKTNPEALNKFETWEYMTGRSSQRP